MFTVGMSVDTSVVCPGRLSVDEIKESKTR